VAIVGLLALVFASRFSDLDGVVRSSPHVLLDLLFFAVLGCLLDMMIVPMAHGGAVSAGMAVFYAALLTLGPVLASCVAVLATIWTDLVVRRTVSVHKTLFNVGHVGIGLLLAGAIYYRLMGGQVNHVHLASLMDYARILASGAFLLLFQTAAVNLAVALDRRAPFRPVFAGNMRLALPMDSALVGIGLLVAILYQHQQALLSGGGWAFVALTLLIPSGLLYYSSKLYMDMYRVYDKTLRTLGALMEVRLQQDDESPQAADASGHGERVGNLAVAVAEEMVLPPHEIEAIRYAGYLHDIGKVGLPAELLRKHGTLSPSDWSRRQEHAEIGYQIVRPIVFLSHVSGIIRYHHLRYDAIPRVEAKGGRVPPGARILRVAEHYDNLTHTHADHSALPCAAALASMVRESGTRFDPRALQGLAHIVCREAAGPTAALEEAVHAL
jgi:putative nucleotidyltransferase with HDIG domain